ncbi:MAG: UpxY family transcription antiterminator, partial [Bacteroidales bacterium]
MAWYALYTSARAEKKVEERLKMMDVETFLPLHKVKRKWSDRIKIVEAPLFTSYIFVNCSEHQVRELPLVYGIAQVVYYLNKPAVIRDKEIEAIKEFLVIAEGKKIITSGDEVEILSGPFKSKTGKVLHITSNKAKLVLKEIGLNVSVSLEEVDIDKKL